MKEQNASTLVKIKPFTGKAAPSAFHQNLIRNFIINVFKHNPELLVLPNNRLYPSQPDGYIPDLVIYKNSSSIMYNECGDVIIEISVRMAADKLKLANYFKKSNNLKLNTKELYVFDWQYRTWYRYNPIDDTWIIQNFSAFLNIDLNTLIESPTP